MDDQSQEQPHNILPPMRYRHKKTGGIYVKLHDANMQSSDWYEHFNTSSYSTVDMMVVVVYQSEKDNSVWVRPVKEFDERFEFVT